MWSTACVIIYKLYIVAVYTQGQLELVIGIDDDDFLDDDPVDEIRISFDRMLRLSSSFSPQSTYTGVCGRARITISFRISSNCPLNMYGPSCSVTCMDQTNQYFCNYLGERQCLGNFAAPDCTQCLPTYFTSTCSVQCIPPSGQCVNFECHPDTGERVCLGNFEGANCDTCIENYYTPCCSTQCIPLTEKTYCNTNGELKCRGNFKLPNCSECVEGFQGSDCDTCASDYYPPNTCEVFCQPRDDSQGHFTCDSDGNPVCLPGFTNVASMCTEEITGKYKILKLPMSPMARYE